jgi:hypothetical protein
MTPLQEAIMNKSALNEYTSVNGAEPQSAAETETWAEMIIESPTDKGVFTSLQNQGLVWYNVGPQKREEVVGLTEKGFQIFLEL